MTGMRLYDRPSQEIEKRPRDRFEAAFGVETESEIADNFPERRRAAIVEILMSLETRLGQEGCLDSSALVEQMLWDVEKLLLQIGVLIKICGIADRISGLIRDFLAPQFGVSKTLRLRNDEKLQTKIASVVRDARKYFTDCKLSPMVGEGDLYMFLVAPCLELDLLRNSLKELKAGGTGVYWKAVP